MGRRIFRNCPGHFMRRINNKGFTLTELMATVAIMVFVAAAFMGASLSVTQNNVLSSDKLNFSVLEQNAMEEIKAKPPDYLNSQADYFVGKDGDLKPYTPVGTPDPDSKDNGLSVMYRVDKIELKTTHPETTPEVTAPPDLDNMKYDLEFGVDKDDKGGYVQFNKKEAQSYNYYLTYSSDTKTNQCFLDVSGSAGSYNYKFYCDSDPMIKSGNFTKDIGNINVKIQFINQSADKFELHIKQDKTLDKSVDFFIYGDDVNELVLVNDGDKEPFLNEYRNLTDQHKTGYYENNLYKITVVIEKNGQVVDTLVSNVKK